MTTRSSASRRPRRRHEQEFGGVSRRRLQSDGRRVELVETKTTMRYAFEAAVAAAAQTATAEKLAQLKELFDGTAPRAGIRKRPGWRVSRRGRKGRR